MSNLVYDILNKIQRWLPALGIAWLSIAEIWHLPLGAEINNTIVTVAALLAATVEVASCQYYKEQ